MIELIKIIFLKKNVNKSVNHANDASNHATVTDDHADIHADDVPSDSSDVDSNDNCPVKYAESVSKVADDDSTAMVADDTIAAVGQNGDVKL